MPLYTVSHAAPLSLGQKEALAEAITNLHADRFKTPRWYINVIFTDASSQTVFVGGRQVSLSPSSLHLGTSPC
jgi:phenylpyruvate tautomerase PptA (4-oxalocrotonate tautomerase family)